MSRLGAEIELRSMLWLFWARMGYTGRDISYRCVQEGSMDHEVLDRLLGALSIWALACMDG